MIEAIASLYQPRFVKSIVYMLQASEYHAGAYLTWLWRTTNFNKVMHRRQLKATRAAKLLMLALATGLLLHYVVSIVILVLAIQSNSIGLMEIACGLILIAPLLWAHLILVPLVIGNWLIIKPTHARKVRRSEKQFAEHQATIIAIAGSYGKTTMKELLKVVLGSGKKVAATPGNKNVPISHANFASKLEGDEDILLVEYGEGAPGDVARFARRTHPDIGIITGLAPAHLDRYKTIEKAGKDIFSLATYLKDNNVYVNGENEALKHFVRHGHFLYGQEGVAGWRVEKPKVSIEGTSFMLKKGKTKFSVHSHLLGRHQIGPLALAAVVADSLGLTKKQIEDGLKQTVPFEHRMQPKMVAGAWVIDDTYNGNIEGMKAGLRLLAELPAKRKIYITPGLVDQGRENERVHLELGKAIAHASPDKVVLIENSVAKLITKGLEDGGFENQLIIERDPLEFYTNLDSFVAAGDIVLMQNDWTDNYA